MGVGAGVLVLVLGRRIESEDGVCVGWEMRGETVGEGRDDRELLYEYGRLRGRA